MTTDKEKLPPLPEPAIRRRENSLSGDMVMAHYYTADQMHEFRREGVEAERARCQKAMDQWVQTGTIST